MTALRPTSIAARASLGSAARTQRQQVFLHLLKCGSMGATLNELEAALGISGNTVRPRRLELEQSGLIEDSGLRRPTPSGRQAVVWVVKSAVVLAVKSKLKGLP